MADEDRLDLQPILFGGLNTHHNELFLTGAHSPLMLNAHLYPVGSLSKRDGVLAVTYGAGIRAEVPGSGKCKMLHFLSKITEDAGHIYTVRDGNIYRSNLDLATQDWVDTGITPDAASGKFGAATAYYLDETVSPEVLWNECLYVANKLEKPLILTGDPITENKVWQEGEYNVTPASQVPGYPERWPNPKGDFSVEDWPSHFAVYGKGFGMRLVAWGFALDPQRIDYSVAGVPYNFLLADLAAPPSDPDAETAPGIDGGFFYAERGDGDPVVSVQTYKDYAVVYKRFTTLFYTGTQVALDADSLPTVNPFTLQGSVPHGAVSHESIVVVGNDHYFWSPEGPRKLSATFAHGDIVEDIVSREIQKTVRSVARGNQEKIVGRHEPEFGRVLWHVPVSGAAENNKVLCYYYPTSLDPAGRWTEFDGRYSEMVATVMAHPMSTAYKQAFGAGADGVVYDMNVGTFDGYDESSPGVWDVPRPISLIYETRWFILHSLIRFVRALFMDVVVSDEGFGGIKIEYAWDYSNLWEELDDPLSATADEGSGYWDYVTWDEFNWDESSRALLHFGLSGLGRIIRFRITDDTVFGCGLGGISINAASKGTK